MSPLLSIIITIKYIHYLCCLDQLIRFIIKFTQKKLPGVRQGVFESHTY